jgi:hypothetical protein
MKFIILHHKAISTQVLTHASKHSAFHIRETSDRKTMTSFSRRTMRAAKLLSNIHTHAPHTHTHTHTHTQTQQAVIS